MKKKIVVISHGTPASDISQMRKKNVIITYALPGAGKTTYLKNNYSRYSTLDVDNIQKDGIDWVQKRIKEHLTNRREDNFALDILIATNEDLISIIEVIKSTGIEFNISVIVFSEDRKNSLKNDLYRGRNKNAQTTINTMPYTPINKELYDKDMKFIYVDTYVLTDWQDKIKELNLSVRDDKYLTSDSWSLGGRGGNCYGDRWDITVENPCEFKELDELLEKIKPSITFLEYRKLERECVTIEEYDSGDYYSSSTSARWKCDLEILFSIINS